jgi:hypothetical protein
MTQSVQEMKWAENELIFRKANERASGQISRTLDIAGQEKQSHTVEDMDDMPLQFYCECSNEDCKERIRLSPKEYTAQHKNSNQFLLLKGHHNPEIERIMTDNDIYIVVEKYITPPKGVGKLQKT